MNKYDEDSILAIIKLIGYQPLDVMTGMLLTIPKEHLCGEDAAFLIEESYRLSSLGLLVTLDSDDEYDIKMLMVSLISSVLSKLSHEHIIVWIESFQPHPDITTSGWGIA